ncbi:hypothetical protein K4K54_003988 [Colletotrichum sp. SAR 10_86]|nr:hypothetical protein K4K54_003988 [Colletotrichum sp. SAR 10_86]
MQTLASDLEYVLLNKLVPFEVDEDELHALVDDTVAHVNKLLSCCKTGSQDEAKAYVDNFCDEIASDWDMCLMSEEPIDRLWQAVIESIISWLSEDVDLNTYDDTNRKYLGNSIIVLVENDGQTTPQKRKADEVFNTNDDKIVGSPRKKSWEQDSIAETGFLGTADEPGPDKEAGEEMDMDKAKHFPMSELDQNMDFKYEKPEMDDEEQDDLKTDAEQELYQARMLK